LAADWRNRHQRPHCGETASDIHPLTPLFQVAREPNGVGGSVNAARLRRDLFGQNAGAGSGATLRMGTLRVERSEGKGRFNFRVASTDSNSGMTQTPNPRRHILASRQKSKLIIAIECRRITNIRNRNCRKPGGPFPGLFPALSDNPTARHSERGRSGRAAIDDDAARRVRRHPSKPARFPRDDMKIH
jgi:hypothetical protein